MPIAPQKKSPDPLHPLLVFAGFFFLALIIYWPALHGGFIWDDAEMLMNNHAVRSPNGLLAIWSGKQVDYFPLTSTVFWLEWRCWAVNPVGYRVVNVALHVGSAVLIWQILRRWKIPGAGLAAAIFCVHPVCVASVAWVAELKNTLSLFFALLSVYFFQRINWAGPEKKMGVGRDYYYSLLCFLLALLGKISVVMLPLVLLGCTGVRWKKALWRLAPFFGLSLVLGLVNVWMHEHRAMAMAKPGELDGLLVRLLGGGQAVWFYLWKDLWPLHLTVIYPRASIRSDSLSAWIPGVTWLISLFGCWFLSRRFAWGRVLFFGLAAFWITLLPVLGVAQISFFLTSRVADHLQYFSIIGVIAVMACALTMAGEWLGNLLSNPSKPARPSRAVKVPSSRPATFPHWLLPLLVTGALAVAARQRAQLFSDPEKLWRANLVENPSAPMAWANLAYTLSQQGHSPEAVENYTQAVQLDPDNLATREQFAGVLNQLGRLDEAVAQFRVILAQDPKNSRAHSNLGAVLAAQGLLPEAAAEFQIAIAQSPAFLDARNNLGSIFGRLGRYDEAIKEFEEVLRLNPAYPGGYNNLQEVKRLQAAAKAPRN